MVNKDFHNEDAKYALILIKNLLGMNDVSNLVHYVNVRLSRTLDVYTTT